MTRFIRSCAHNTRRANQTASLQHFLAVNDERILLDFDGIVEKEPVWRAAAGMTMNTPANGTRLRAFRPLVLVGLTLGILTAIGAYLFQPFSESIRSISFIWSGGLGKSLDRFTPTAGHDPFAGDSGIRGTCWTFQTECTTLPRAMDAPGNGDALACNWDTDSAKGIADACVKLCSDIRTHFASNEKLHDPLGVVPPERKTPSVSVEKVVDQLQSVEAQRKGCELALELMKKGNSVFSGFMPEPAGAGVESLKVFQAKIAELEIKRKSLATRFMPQSKELHVINEEMSAVRDTMRECLTEYVAFLDRKKDYLTATRLDLEGKTSSVAGRNPEDGGSPIGRPEHFSLPQVNPGSLPLERKPLDPGKPAFNSASETALGIFRQVVSNMKSMMVTVRDSVPEVLFSGGVAGIDADGLFGPNPGFGDFFESPGRVRDDRYAASRRRPDEGIVGSEGLGKKVTRYLPQLIFAECSTPDCTRQSLNMDQVKW